MSSPRRVLVTGAAGLLGANLVCELRSRLDIVGTYHNLPSPSRGACAMRLDITDREAVAGSLDLAQPDVVIHCAALTSVDLCERRPDLAHRVNAAGTRWIAEACQRLEARLICISTDAVYPGVSGGYRESDATGPMNTYARSKLSGEREALSVCNRTLVLRVNMFGWNYQPKHSLAEWFLAQAAAGNRQIPGYHEVRFSPLLVNDIADIVSQLIQRNTSGVLNVGAADACSKYDFGRMVLEEFGYDPDAVAPTGVRGDPRVAPRPLDSSMDVGLLRDTLGASPPTVCDGIRRLKTARSRLLRCASCFGHARQPRSGDGKPTYNTMET